MFENVFSSIDHEKIDLLVKSTPAADEVAQTPVKIKGKDIVVPAGKVFHVRADVGRCRADAGQM